MMYSVRIDKDRDGYVFRVQPTEGVFEMVALDSTPAIIAFVHANDPGDAAQRAWEKGTRMHDENPEQLANTEQFLSLLGKP